MAESPKTVFVDDAVPSKVLDIIQDARKYVIVVTPFVKIRDWRHAENALDLAVKKGVKVATIVRCKDEKPDWGDIEEVIWLQQHGVDVRTAEYLHAKIYLNEREVLVSSMNLHQFSANNSSEIGILVRDKEAEAQVRKYVVQTLMGRAKRLGVVTAGPARPAATNSARPAQAAAGFCIRCSTPITLNPSKPLCPGHYEVWAAWGNEDYEEEFCHACGQPSDTSYARPLCRDCYQRGK
jgi:phosphatidylserine/phosphatidylglycerophosphate/cardiolipin synthase-like enzyme